MLYKLQMLVNMYAKTHTGKSCGFFEKNPEKGPKNDILDQNTPFKTFFNDYQKKRNTCT